MKSKLEIYALAVCFTCVVSLVISASIMTYSAFEVITPELTLPTYRFQTDLTPQQLDKAIYAEKKSGIQTLIKCSIVILFSCVTLITHWKIAKKA